MMNTAFFEGLTTLLIHHLWQAALLVGAVALLFRHKKAANPKLRYGIWSATFLSLALLPAAVMLPKPVKDAKPSVEPQPVAATVAPVEPVPAVSVQEPSPALPASPAEAVAAEPPMPTVEPLPTVEMVDPAPSGVGEPANQPASPEPPNAIDEPEDSAAWILHEWIGPIAPWLFAIWAIVATLLLARITVGIVKLNGIVNRSKPLQDQTDLLAWFCSQTRDFPGDVRLQTTDELVSPAAVGWFRKVVLIPTQLLAKLETREVHAVVLHELAHLRRGDAWTNLFQKFVEAMFFFNPAVKWASRQIDLAREEVCDRWALDAAGGSRSYARCLVKVFENTRGIHQPALALGVVDGESQLSRRVDSLLSGKSQRGFISRALPFAAVVILTSGFALITLATPSPAFAVQPQQEEMTLEERREREQERALAAEQQKKLELERALIAEQKALVREEKDFQKAEYKARVEEIASSMKALQDRIESLSANGQENRSREAEQRKLREALVRAERELHNLQQEHGQISDREELRQDLERMRALEKRRYQQELELRARQEELQREQSEDIEQEELRRLRDEEISLMLHKVTQAQRAEKLQAEMASLQENLMRQQEREAKQRSLHGSYTSHSSTESHMINRTDDMNMEVRGKVVFRPDETGIASLSPNGLFLVEDLASPRKVKLEVRADRDGNLTYRYWENGRELDSANVHSWLADNLPEFLRESGLDAENRIHFRIEQYGLDETLNYAYGTQSDYARSAYFMILAKTNLLDTGQLLNLAEETRSMDSDFQKSRVFGVLLGANNADVPMIAEKMDTIDSDFENRRIWLKALEIANDEDRDQIAEIAMARLSTIASDFEKRTLMTAIAKILPFERLVDLGYLEAIAQIGSDFEIRQTLVALMNSGEVINGYEDQILGLVATVSSDFEKRTMLVYAAKLGWVTPTFFQVVDSIRGDFEKATVLRSVLKHEGLSDDALGGIIESARTISGNHEKSRVLLDIIRDYSLPSNLEADLEAAINSVNSNFERERLRREWNKR